MFAVNRITAIKLVRRHIRRYFDKVIDESNPNSLDIRMPKEEFAIILNNSTGLKVCKDLVDSFAEEYVPHCDNCKVIRRWEDIGGGIMTLTRDGKVRDKYGQVCKTFDQITMDLILRLITEKEEIISGGSYWKVHLIIVKQYHSIPNTRFSVCSLMVREVNWLKHCTLQVVTWRRFIFQLNGYSI